MHIPQTSAVQWRGHASALNHIGYTRTHISHALPEGLMCETQSRRLFTGQYVTVLMPDYTSRPRDAPQKKRRGRRGVRAGAEGWLAYSCGALPREPRRPCACTSHPVAGQRMRRSFPPSRDFHISTTLPACVRACLSDAQTQTRLKTDKTLWHIFGPVSAGEPGFLPRDVRRNPASGRREQGRLRCT